VDVDVETNKKKKRKTKRKKTKTKKERVFVHDLRICTKKDKNGYVSFCVCLPKSHQDRLGVPTMVCIRPCVVDDEETGRSRYGWRVSSAKATDAGITVCTCNSVARKTSKKHHKE